MAVTGRPPRLLAIDLDGTLLNSERKITPGTLSVVSRIASSGIHVVLVSARMPRSVASYRDQLGIRDPLIACNGSLILTEEGITHLGDIPPVAARKILQLASKFRPGLHISMYVDDEWYVNELDVTAQEESKALGIVPRVAADVGTVAGAGPAKITLIGVPNVMASVSDEIRQNFPEVYCVFSRSTDLEVLRRGISKGSALRSVCARLGVDPEQVAAIGDQMNDEDMLQFAGIGIAMGNAPDELKRAATFVAPPNDEEGLVFALRELYPYLREEM